MKKLSYLLALAAPISASAAETDALVRFIACPVYRDADSGRKSGCWLADDTAAGIRYDVSQSPYKPDWNRAVLVEGRVSSEAPSPCGAPVLNPVRSSVLPDACQRHMLPAEGYPGRKFVLPARNLSPTSVVRTPPAGPYTKRTFALFFEFDRSFITYQYTDYLFDQAALWLEAAKPKKVVIIGFAATAREQVSGRDIAERADVAKERADVVAESLRRLLPGLQIETLAQGEAKVADLSDADGLPGQSQRRVEIRAVF